MQSCPTCVNAYDSADHKLRCRIHPRGLICSPALAADCGRFEEEIGADAEESPWFKGAWCCDKQGRGDAGN